jgi:hypothetical protein
MRTSLGAAPRGATTLTPKVLRSRQLACLVQLAPRNTVQACY